MPAGRCWNRDDPVVRADWHLARLWLGPAGGGPVVAGTRKRSLIPATHGTKTFLGAQAERAGGGRGDVRRPPPGTAGGTARAAVR